ncbi:MAG: NnrS family protein [Campylobacterales bacterium]|nr:NnrS family protein [Campylobacterales bacterium]
MVFVSSLTPPPSPKTSPWQNLLALPHRLFFFSGIVQGVVFVVLLGMQFSGWIALHVRPEFYHGYAMAFVVFTQFFVGFLLTTFPRYLARPSAPKSAYLWPALALSLGGVGLAVFSFVSETWTLLAMVLVLVGYGKLAWVLWSFQRQSSVPNKQDTSWMLVAFAFGALSQLLFMAAFVAPTLHVALNMSFYMYLFLVVIVVSQKMIPFFAANRVQGYEVRKSTYFLPVVFGGLLLKVALESLGLNALLADGLLFGVITLELVRWKLPFRQSPPILWVLFLSIWWAPVGFLLFTLQGLSSWFDLGWHFGHAPLHALALGYFTTVLIGFGTRVLLGHSGRTPVADGYAVALFGLVQTMTLLRVGADLFPAHYLSLIGLSALAWLGVFGWWAGRYGKILFEK